MAKLTLTDGTIFEGTTEEIFAITERFGAKAEEPLKVGDRVRVLNAGQFGGVRQGDVGVVKRFTDSAYSVRVDGASDHDYFRIQDLRKVTGDEVAEERKKAIFTQAGRKPNEYRKGDIVGYDSIKYGQVVIREVTAVDGNEVVYYSEGFGKDGVLKDSERLTLIATVESRLDRN